MLWRNIIIKKDKVEYEKFETQDYIINNRITNYQKTLVFKYRTHMLEFKENFKGSNEDRKCPVCGKHPDSQDLIDECEELRTKFENIDRCKNLYSDVIEEKDVRLLESIIKEREKIHHQEQQ